MKTRINKFLTILLSILFLTLPVILSAQTNDVEMADVMRSNGKIYVVIAVVSVILAGLLVFLISIDRRVKRMENEEKKK